MKINLNQIVRVTLTKVGADALNRHENSQRWGSMKLAEHTAGEVIETHLWDIMGKFGHLMFAPGSDVPFVGNCIEVSERTLPAS